MSIELEKVKQEYEIKIAKLQTEFVRTQISMEKEHAKEVSKCLQKIEANESNTREISV